MVKTNEGMRTRIVEQGSGPVQYFAPYRPFKIDLQDFTGRPLVELYQWDAKLSQVPFKFLDSDLFYFVMFKLSDSDGGYFCNFHHIITDAWTEMLLYSQVMTAYRAFCEGREPDDSPAPAYHEYIAREQKYLASPRFANDKEYWISQYTPLPDLATLQTKKITKKSLAAHRKAFLLSREEAERIRTFCTEKELTVFSFFLTMLTIYINRITGSDDIVLGTTVLNRLNAREKTIFGMFISTVPLRFRLNQANRYIDFARGITANWLSVLRHQQYPYDLTLRDLRKEHGNADTTGNLFEITISYQNAKTSKEILQWDGATRWHFPGYQNEPLVIHINDRDDEGSLILNYDYNISCFADKEIDFIHSHFKSLIADAITNPDKPIRALSLIGSEELQRIEGFNNTAEDYDRRVLFLDRFHRQVDLTPAAPAAVFHDHTITYRELDNEANRIGHFLRHKDVKRDDIVAVMLPRGLGLLSSILGVIKAGGAFLPIDPSYPQNRIKYMLSNSSAKIIITSGELGAQFALDPRLLVSPGDPQAAAMPSSRPRPVNEAEDLVYIIYTSGSTGFPKGVMIQHSGLRSFIHAFEKTTYYQPGEAALSLSTVAFDLFISEVFPALVNGMKVVITDESEQRIPLLQKELIKRHGIVKFMGTPSRMQYLLDEPGHNDCFSCLKEVILAGEVFPAALLKRMKVVISAEILNGYGPTETTIGATIKRLTDTNEINIGRPFANTKIYILDKNMNLTPIGVPGEIYIGGEGLARGYLNNKELTAERFVPNPFHPGERLYRTGDLGRWYPQGEIAFLGRIDSQVKIRGLRIELGEIENAIRQHPGICDAVVLDIEDRGKKSLCAYIVSQDNHRPDFGALRYNLSKRLPAFMVPSFFVSIGSIPLNNSGKVNRHALPAPDKSQLQRRAHRQPSNLCELKLARIWEQILDLDDVDPDEDFFALGGDSLDVVNLVTAIQSDFGIELTIEDIYNHTTCAKQAARLGELDDSGGVTPRHPNLVLLKRNASASNLFMVHAGSGEVSNYHQLCRLLSANINCCGIRYLPDHPASEKRQISEISGHYLIQVRAIQPKGPYFLAGWCLGGTIAFEIARQLEEAGEKVSLLAMINTICPRRWDGYENEERAVLSSLLAGKKCSPPDVIMDTDTLWNYVMEKVLSGQISAGQLRADLPRDAAEIIPNYATADETTLVKYLNIIRTLHYARADYYPPGILAARVCLLEAALNDAIADPQTNLAAWQKYCALPLQRSRVEGGHFSMFSTQHLGGLAQTLDSVLRQYLP